MFARPRTEFGCRESTWSSSRGPKVVLGKGKTMAAKSWTEFGCRPTKILCRCGLDHERLSASQRLRGSLERAKFPKQAFA